MIVQKKFKLISTLTTLVYGLQIMKTKTVNMDICFNVSGGNTSGWRRRKSTQNSFFSVFENENYFIFLALNLESFLLCVFFSLDLMLILKTVRDVLHKRRIRKTSFKNLLKPLSIHVVKLFRSELLNFYREFNLVCCWFIAAVVRVYFLRLINCHDI